MAAIDPRLADREAALSTARALQSAHGGGWNPAHYSRNAVIVPAMVAAVLESFAPRPDERILDLGCGDGLLTARIVRDPQGRWTADYVRLRFTARRPG